MKIIDGVRPTVANPKARKYGEFGLLVQLEPAELEKLRMALEYEPHIVLAFGYFTDVHLQEAIGNGGHVLLTACWEKAIGASRNDGELWDDAKSLEEWLGTAYWHGFHHDIGLGVLVPFYKPLCDKIAEGEIHPDDVPDLDNEYRQDPKNFIYCKFYGLDGTYYDDVHYETLTDSLGVSWTEDPDYFTSWDMLFFRLKQSKETGIPFYKLIDSCSAPPVDRNYVDSVLATRKLLT